MSTTAVYVVMGTSGEYSDRTEWPVRAFLDGQRAAEAVVQLEAKAEEILQARMQSGSHYYPWLVANELDPKFSPGDTSYFIHEVELCGDETIAAIVQDEERRLRRAIALKGEIPG